MESPWSKKVKVAKGEDWRRANPDVTGISDGELCQRDRVTSWCGPRVTPDHKSGKHQIYKSTQVTRCGAQVHKSSNHQEQKYALETAICQTSKNRRPITAQ